MKGDRHRSDWVPPQGRTHWGGPMSSARMVSQPPEPELRKEERSWIPAGHSCCRPGMRAATTRSGIIRSSGARGTGARSTTCRWPCLPKDTRGVLRVGRHGSTAKDLALGGSVLSAALLIVAPAVDATVVAAADVVLPGAKGIAAHLRHVVPDEKLQEVSELLGAGACGLLIVAIDRRGTQISPLLEHAEEAAVIETKTGDLDAAFYAAIGPATTTGHAALCRHARAAGPMGAGALLADRSSG